MRPNDDLTCKLCYAPGLAFAELHALATGDARPEILMKLDQGKQLGFYWYKL